MKIHEKVFNFKNSNPRLAGPSGRAVFGRSPAGIVGSNPAAKTTQSGPLDSSTPCNIQEPKIQEGAEDGRLFGLLEEAKVEDIPDTQVDGSSRVLPKHPGTPNKMREKTINQQGREGKRKVNQNSRM
jgi:hypothetical protein